MHGHMSEPQFLQAMSGFLGSYYLILALINGFAALYCWHSLKRGGLGLAWLVVALGFTLLSPIAYSGNPSLVHFLSLPAGIRDFVDNHLASPEVYGTGTLVLFLILFAGRKFFTLPVVAWAGLNAALLVMGLSMTDQEFAQIVTKPDNVPIVGMVFLLGYFTWLSAYQAVRNDERIARGQGPLEADNQEKVLVWPDLVYTELICMVAITAILILWAIGLRAPLEDAASSVKTPNPSKAPWYFLGLQEMLVYFDPWMAGVVLPSMIIFGLMAVPYIDFNKTGNGYYTINQRKFSYLMFQFGFLVLWVTLIILGTFLRGPNWNFFGPYEEWDAHKVVALNNVNLSQYFWIGLLDKPLPQYELNASALWKIVTVVQRELPGILVVGGYLVMLPPLLAMTIFRSFYLRMGFIRYMVLSNLLLMMMMLPIKMVLRWTLNLKYLIAIPEIALNL